MVGKSLRTISVVLTTLIAIDRNIHMNPKIESGQSKIKKILKMPYIFYIIALVIFFCVSSTLVDAFLDYGNETVKIATYSILMGIFLMYILVTVCLYTRGYLRIRKFANTNPVYCDREETPDNVRNLYKTVLLLVLLACCLFVPYCITSLAAVILYLSGTSDPFIMAPFNQYADLLVDAGSFANCIVVLYFNKKAKDWIFSKIRNHCAN